MCKSLGFEATPWEISEAGEYWQNAILVEYEVEQNPQVQAYYEKQRKKAEQERLKLEEKDKSRSRERQKSRERAGENHLETVDAPDQ